MKSNSEPSFSLLASVERTGKQEKLDMTFGPNTEGTVACSKVE
jgi:hypothetical protein